MSPFRRLPPSPVPFPQHPIHSLQPPQSWLRSALASQKWLRFARAPSDSVFHAGNPTPTLPDNRSIRSHPHNRGFVRRREPMTRFIPRARPPKWLRFVERLAPELASFGTVRDSRVCPPSDSTLDLSKNESRGTSLITIVTGLVPVLAIGSELETRGGLSRIDPRTRRDPDDGYRRREASPRSERLSGLWPTEAGEVLRRPFPCRTIADSG